MSNFDPLNIYNVDEFSMKRIRQGVEKKDEQTIDGEELKSIEMSLGKMVQDFR